MLVDVPPKKINMSPEKGPFQKENSFSNHRFSGDMLGFWVGKFDFYLHIYVYHSNLQPLFLVVINQSIFWWI